MGRRYCIGLKVVLSLHVKQLRKSEKATNVCGAGFVIICKMGSGSATLNLKNLWFLLLSIPNSLFLQYRPGNPPYQAPAGTGSHTVLYISRQVPRLKGGFLSANVISMLLLLLRLQGAFSKRFFFLESPDLRSRPVQELSAEGNMSDMRLSSPSSDHRILA